MACRQAHRSGTLTPFPASRGPASLPADALAEVGDVALPGTGFRMDPGFWDENP